MPLQRLLCVATPTPASYCGIRRVSTRCSLTKRDWASAGERVVTISIAGGELLLRRPRGLAPIGSHDAVSSGVAAARTPQQGDLFSVQGIMRTALLRGANHKRWVAQSSNSEQGQEILEKNNQSSEENSGPPVLTIIAGLLVLFLVFWALGSLVSWIVGLIFKS